MTQNDILNFLKENKAHSFSCKEIAKALNRPSACISRCLAKLRQFKQIDFYTKGINGYKYFYKVKDDLEGLN